MSGINAELHADKERRLDDWIEAIKRSLGDDRVPEVRSLDEVWGRLARVQQRRGDHSAAAATLADAIRQARRRVARAGDRETLVARLLMDRAEALERVGEYSSGADLLEEAHAILVRELGRLHADVEAVEERLAQFHERWAEAQPEVPGTIDRARRWRERRGER